MNVGKTWEYGNRTGFPSGLAEPIDVTSHSLVAPIIRTRVTAHRQVGGDWDGIEVSGTSALAWPGVVAQDECPSVSLKIG